MSIFQIDTHDEREYTDDEKSFIGQFNKQIKTYTKENKDYHLTFNIKLFWCIEKQLLLLPLLFHPLNLYWVKTGEEILQKVNFKNTFREIIEWELDSDKKSYLNKEELEAVIKVYNTL